MPVMGKITFAPLIIYLSAVLLDYYVNNLVFLPQHWYLH